MAKEKPTTLQGFVDSGVIRELNPELARKAIEGYADALAPAVRVQEAFYRQFVCISCGSSNLTKEYIGGPAGRGTTWTGDVLPNAMLRCTQCRLLFNPHTRMVIEVGEEVAVPDHLPQPGLIRK